MKKSIMSTNVLLLGILLSLIVTSVYANPPKDMERKAKVQSKPHIIKRHPSQNTLQSVSSSN